MVYRTWSFTDITLTPEEAEAYHREAVEWHKGRNTGEFMADYRELEPSPLEEELRRRYHEAAEAKDRLDAIEEWVQYLLRLFADMTPLEQQNYGRRVHGLLQIAQATIHREVRKAQLEMYEEHLGQLGSPSHKITGTPPFEWTDKEE